MEKENSTGFNLIREWYEQGNSDILQILRLYSQSLELKINLK
jgi:hypothetical protein